MTAEAKRKGFKKCGNIYWKSLGELIVLVTCAHSRLSGAKRVEFGLVPASFMHGERPPPSHGWGCRMFASDAPLQHGIVFTELQRHGYLEISESDLAAACHELFGWIDTEFADEDKLRRELLSRTAWYDMYMTVVLHDWARGELKNALHYFDTMKYYRAAADD